MPHRSGPSNGERVTEIRGAAGDCATIKSEPQEVIVQPDAAVLSGIGGVIAERIVVDPRWTTRSWLPPRRGSHRSRDSYNWTSDRRGAMP
jgi:hypothetical protein